LAATKRIVTGSGARQWLVILRRVPKTLLVVQDDLFFASRVQTHARGLGIPVELVAPGDIEARSAQPGTVVVMQLTLHRERAFALLEQLRARTPPVTVLAVTGHLETDLRRRARSLGARLATNSALDRALSRAATEVNQDDDGPG
jgi:CheY-like chemotaxis protein